MLRTGDGIELGEGQEILRFSTRDLTLTLDVASLVEGGELVVDSKSRDVWVRRERFEPPLSRKEFDVVRLLFQKRGEACSRDTNHRLGLAGAR